jgi:hypothetical protein
MEMRAMRKLSSVVCVAVGGRSDGVDGHLSHARLVGGAGVSFDFPQASMARDGNVRWLVGVASMIAARAG